MGQEIITAAIVLVGVPLVLIGYILAVEWLLHSCPRSARIGSGRGSGSPRRWRSCSCS